MKIQLGKVNFLPLLVLVFLVLLFFYKIFWGLIPIPADLIVGSYYPWLDSKWANLVGVPVKNSLITDAVSIIYPLRSYAMDLIKQGQFPLWNPFMFAGYPIIGSQPVGLYFPSIFFYLIFSSSLAWTFQVMLQPLLAGIFMYALARHLKLNRWASMFCAIGYSFGGFSLIWLEWNTQATASAFLPLLILLEDRLLTDKRKKWGILLSFALAVQIFSGYFPVTLFSLLAMGIWFLFRASIANFLNLTFFILAGLGLSSILLFPSWELFQNSQRLHEVIGLSGSFVPYEYLLTLLSPDFFGNPSTGNFWGLENYLNAAFYSGVTAVVLAVVGIFGGPRLKVVYPLLTILIITAVIITPNPLAKVLYQINLWGGSSVTMNRALFLVNFSIALLSGIGLGLAGDKSFKSYLQSSLGVTGILLVMAALTYILKDWQPGFNISLKNLIFPLTISLTCLLIILLCKIFKLSKQILMVGLLILLTVELFRFGWKFNPFTPARYLYPQTPLTDFLKEQVNSRFVSEMPILPPNMWVPYRLQSLAGYDAFYPLGAAKLIAVINSNDINAAPQTKNGVITSFVSPLLNITGTNLVVVPKRDDQNNIKPDGTIDPKLNQGRFEKVFEAGSVVVLKNLSALPRVYQTTRVIQADQKEALEILSRDSFQAVGEDFSFTSEDVITKQPQYQQISNDHVQIKTAAPSNSVLVVLDNYYPGWEATVDSSSTQIYKVNYTFRGVVVPAGGHIVDFYYRPKSLQYGILVSVLTAGILLFPLCYRRP